MEVLVVGISTLTGGPVMGMVERNFCTHCLSHHDLFHVMTGISLHHDALTINLAALGAFRATGGTSSESTYWIALPPRSRTIGSTSKRKGRTTLVADRDHFRMQKRFSILPKQKGP